MLFGTWPAIVIGWLNGFAPTLAKVSVAVAVALAAVLVPAVVPPPAVDVVLGVEIVGIVGRLLVAELP